MPKEASPCVGLAELTRKDYDRVKHYGDVSKINGAEVEPVDIITFGSPCQDLSVAGKRAGIQDGERSNLFFEAIRIIKEMREATNDEYPKYAVWENVPGAFSSNKGHDFHAVLEAFCSVCDGAVSIPKPYDAKQTDKLVWNKAGEIVGDNYSIAWRTLDAQYWGVPQRRKRIYLVADFTGQRAGEILFKPEGLRGNIAKSNETGEGATTDAVGGANGSSGNGGQLAATLISSYGTKWNGNAGAYNGENFVLQKRSVDGSVGAAGFLSTQGSKAMGIGFAEEQSPTLRAGLNGADVVIALQANGIDRADTAGCNGRGWRENESYTLNTIDRHAVCFEPGAMVRDMGNRAWEEQSPTLRANMGDNQPAVCFENHQHGGYREGCGTLRASGGDYGGGSENVVCYDARGNGDSAKQYLFENHSQDTRYKGPLDVSPIVSATFGTGGNNLPFVIQEEEPPRKYIIRRLTPTECARLQGFPDWWSSLAPYNPDDAEFWEEVRKTDLEIRGKKHRPVKSIEKWYEKLHTDSAEYKMWGNGLALPNAEYVLRGIAEHGAKTLGSLFDGSGGFPLAGVLNGIKPIWASEVEPYPIAVTKSRFKEETGR